MIYILISYCTPFFTHKQIAIRLSFFSPSILPTFNILNVWFFRCSIHAALAELPGSEATHVLARSKHIQLQLQVQIILVHKSQINTYSTVSNYQVLDGIPPTWRIFIHILGRSTMRRVRIATQEGPSQRSPDTIPKLNSSVNIAGLEIKHHTNVLPGSTGIEAAHRVERQLCAQL